MTIEETGVAFDAVALTDLGEQLQSPDGAARRADLAARFDRLIRQIQHAMNAGVSIEEHARLQKIQRAVQTAHQLLGSHS